jgi:hypothetical protein
MDGGREGRRRYRDQQTRSLFEDCTDLTTTRVCANVRLRKPLTQVVGALRLRGQFDAVFKKLKRCFFGAGLADQLADDLPRADGQGLGYFNQAFTKILLRAVACFT